MIQQQQQRLLEMHLLCYSQHSLSALFILVTCSHPPISDRKTKLDTQMQFDFSTSILLILVINYTNQTLEHLNIYMLVIFLLETVTFIFFCFFFIGCWFCCVQEQQSWRHHEKSFDKLNTRVRKGVNSVWEHSGREV